jgi:hypothetical protein
LVSSTNGNEYSKTAAAKKAVKRYNNFYWKVLKAEIEKEFKHESS